jgi:hypothetical protein
MDTYALFARHRDAIRTLDLAAVVDAHSIPPPFLLGREGRLSSHYLPFDHINTDARVVVAGICPGFTQWKNAMREAQRQLLAGAPDAGVLRAAKIAGAFSGPIRPNLVALLDAIGVQHWLGLAGCASLFGEHAHLVHVTSVLRQAIFVNGVNYNGTPDMVRNPFLRRHLLEYFAEEARRLPGAIYIPMGPRVSEALSWLAQQGVLDGERILHGLPHPSGANAERVAYFLGRKDRATLSSKTNGDQLDAVKAALLARMARLG